MKKHTQIFCNFWNDELTLSQTYQCFKRFVMGGSKCKDHITNLTCLCRKCHDLCHKSKDFNKSVQVKTLRLIADKIEEQIEGNYEH